MGFDLRDRVVFITGASGGIGRACAIEYQRAGCKVVVAARSVAKLESLADELGRDRVLPVVMDVTDAVQRQSGLEVARERFGPIDVLVNNAAWACFSSVLRLPSEHLHRMAETNVLAPVALIQAVLPDMLKKKSGQIVNISSVVGTQAIPRMGFYSATKSAINGLSTALRMELKGTGVDVIVVQPSSTKTDFFDSAISVDVKAVRLANTQYTADRVARAVVKSSRLRRREITLSAEGKAITLIRRLSHRLADSIMYRVARYAMPVEER